MDLRLTAIFKRSASELFGHPRIVMPASEPHPKCPACGRPARPGIRCIATYCPYELQVNKLGVVVLARPLRQRIK